MSIVLVVKSEGIFLRHLRKPEKQTSGYFGKELTAYQECDIHFLPQQASRIRVWF